MYKCSSEALRFILMSFLLNWNLETEWKMERQKVVKMEWERGVEGNVNGGDGV